MIMDVEVSKEFFGPIVILLLTAILLSFVLYWDYKGRICKNDNKKDSKNKKWEIIYKVFLPPSLILLSILLSILIYVMLEVVETIPFIIGLAMTLALGSLVPIFLDCATKDINIKGPKDREKEWDELSKEFEKGGEYIGILERILFFVALWFNKPVYIGVY
jgi:hypothetical protein